MSRRRVYCNALPWSWEPNDLLNWVLRPFCRCSETPHLDTHVCNLQQAWPNWHLSRKLNKTKERLRLQTEHLSDSFLQYLGCFVPRIGRHATVVHNIQDLMGRNENKPTCNRPTQAKRQANTFPLLWLGWVHWRSTAVSRRVGDGSLAGSILACNGQSLDFDSQLCIESDVLIPARGRGQRIKVILRYM